MIKKSAILLGVALLTGLMFSWFSSPAPATARFQLTPFPTPTPGDDGRILYTVQAGDTLWRIAAVSGVGLEQLRSLNGLGVDDVLQEGQVILLGLAGPAQPTQGPEATAATPLPEATATPGVSAGTICVLAYDDLNGDGIRQEEELPVAGGEASVTERTALFSGTSETTVLLEDGTETFPCFEDIPVGNYNVTVAIPEGYNATTALNVGIDLAPGDVTQLNFGAQLSSAAAAEVLPVEEGGRSPVLGILGLVLLALGVGLGAYSFRMVRGG